MNDIFSGLIPVNANTVVSAAQHCIVHINNMRQLELDKRKLEQRERAQKTRFWFWDGWHPSFRKCRNDEELDRKTSGWVKYTIEEFNHFYIEQEISVKQFTDRALIEGDVVYLSTTGYEYLESYLDPARTLLNS